jgi:hypothetical protein
MAEVTGKPAPTKPAGKRGLPVPVKLVFGLVKGGALGAGAGWVATQNALPLWILAALLGVLAGAVAGRAPWSGSAWIATILKAAVGFGVGYGAYWGAGKLGLYGQPYIWLPAFGALWCLLVEVDDAVGGEDAPAKPPAKTA